jgi:succinoglycan biosynthesis protein ExoM
MRGVSLVVCACTYKRTDGLRALLEGLERQTFAVGAPLALHVVIADNEGSEAVRAICAAFRECSGLPLTYVHEPRRGIPFARNACLASLPDDCEYFAFIDDDEVPAPDWLDQLLQAQRTSGADVVAGRVVPLFAEGTPTWIEDGGFFGAPRRLFDLDIPKRNDLQVLDRAATNNVLIRTAAVRHLNLRFDEAFAFSGGSDTLFFRTLHEQGCRIGFAERAVVYDHIPAARASFRYMFRERFRIANNNVLIDALVDGRRRPAFGSALHGAKHVGLGARRLVKTLLSKKRPKDRFAVGAFHAAYGLGIIAAAFGFKYQHYK